MLDYHLECSSVKPVLYEKQSLVVGGGAPVVAEIKLKLVKGEITEQHGKDFAKLLESVGADLSHVLSIEYVEQGGGYGVPKWKKRYYAITGKNFYLGHNPTLPDEFNEKLIGTVISRGSSVTKKSGCVDIVFGDSKSRTPENIQKLVLELMQAIKDTCEISDWFTYYIGDSSKTADLLRGEIMHHECLVNRLVLINC